LEIKKAVLMAETSVDKKGTNVVEKMDMSWENEKVANLDDQLVLQKVGLLVCSMLVEKELP